MTTTLLEKPLEAKNSSIDSQLTNGHPMTLAEYLANPPEHTEWVNGQLINKYPDDDQVSLSVTMTLEEYLQNPPEHTEWVNGQLIEKNDMTLTHGEIQVNLATAWKNYITNHNIGGKVYTDVPCQTHKQGRRPDIAYLTPELVAQNDRVHSLNQSFPLSAEIASPTDKVEDFFSKATEYLESGGLEVWLILPENYLIFVVTTQSIIPFRRGEIARTQVILPGFSVEVDRLLD